MVRLYDFTNSRFAVFCSLNECIKKDNIKCVESNHTKIKRMYVAQIWQ